MHSLITPHVAAMLSRRLDRQGRRGPAPRTVR
jgi:hypothetical protein